MDIQKIQKKAKKNRNRQTEVDIFNVNKEDKNDQQKAKLQEDEDNDDFIIQNMNIKNTDVANTQNQANNDVHKQIWEENTREAIVYNDPTVVEEEEVNPKKVAGWGDGVSKKKNVIQAINEEDLYFPDINNPNAEKQAPKPKPKPASKNEHLFGDNSNFSRPVQDDRFTAVNNLKFTNSKGQVDKLAKLQAIGPVYDAELDDDRIAARELAAEEPIKFKGKISALGEETDADRKRALFMKEINERQDVEVKKEKTVTVWQTSEVKEESRFFNSKGTKQNGFMQQGDGSYNNSNNLEDSAGKRQFTNTKKVNSGFMQPTLDPNVPTVTNQNTVKAKVTLKGWD